MLPPHFCHPESRSTESTPPARSCGAWPATKMRRVGKEGGSSRMMHASNPSAKTTRAGPRGRVSNSRHDAPTCNVHSSKRIQHSAGGATAATQPAPPLGGVSTRGSLLPPPHPPPPCPHPTQNKNPCSNTSATQHLNTPNLTRIQTTRTTYGTTPPKQLQQNHEHNVTKKWLHSQKTCRTTSPAASAPAAPAAAAA